MRVLAIMYCFPPLLVPATMCYVKLVVGLRAMGIDVEVVTIAPETFKSPGRLVLDDELPKLIPSDVVNHVVRSPETSLGVKIAKRLDRKRRFTKRWLEPKKREWTYAALKVLDRVDLGRFDAVLSCSQPHANHLLGLEMKRRLDIPWVAYFSDPWTDAAYAPIRNPSLRAHHVALEDEVLRTADRVLYTSPETLDLVLDRHDALDPARAGILPHAFVPEWYGLEDGGSPPERTSRFHWLHTGSFYGPRTPIPLLDALEKVSRRTPLDGLLRIDSYGDMHPKYVAEVRERGLADVFRVNDFIPYLETLRLMGSSDALVLIDAPLTTTESSVYLPSKLVDYLGAGKPILALTPGRGTSARVVERCGGVVAPLEQPDVIADRIGEMLADPPAGSRAPTPESVQEFHYLQVGRDLADVLEELCA